MRSFAIIVFGLVLMLAAFAHQTDVARSGDRASPQASITPDLASLSR